MSNYNYNEVSKIYDNVRSADLMVIDYLVTNGEINSNTTVMEIGCGTGNYISLIKERTDANIIGYEMSEGMIKKAIEKCPDGDFYNGDASKLAKLDDNSVDLVYMVDVIHHIKNFKEMFINIKRVLKKDGKLYIFTDTHEHIKNRMTSKFFPETLEAELSRYQSTEELTSALKEVGFRDISISAIELGVDSNHGEKLIEIAKNKGYSMFGLISDDAISRGIERIKNAEEDELSYVKRANYISCSST